MKTNKIMIRKMGSFDVLQRTTDSYFDANALLHQWNKNNKRRRMDDFLNSSNTKEFIDALKDEVIANGELSPLGDIQLVKTISSRMTKSGKARAQIYMHPYLFFKFAMWINPKFEIQVINFVYDQLIEFRHEAGDNYNILTEAVAKLKNVNYSEIATAMQWIVFNKRGKDLRQSASQKELKEMAELEKKVAFMIDMGFVIDQTQLMLALRKIYNDKYREL